MRDVKIGLAGTWNPRGELTRMLGLLPKLVETYAGIALVIPAHADMKDLLPLAEDVRVKVVSAPDWSWGRHLALEHALEYPVNHIQYADIDRLLRWIETRPEEWRSSVEAISGRDCVIFGRTSRAYGTHPQAIIKTEAISNRVFSKLLGQPLDLSAGSKGFSRRAGEFLLAKSHKGRALGMDAQWPMLLSQAGYAVEMVWVEGLDWETADRYRTSAAGVHAQRKAAAEYDQDPENWAYRVAVAMEIVAAGLEVINPSLE